MTELSDEVKTFIVHALACFDPPSVVAAAVKEEFEGLVVSRQAVHVYDPTKKAGSELSEQWKTLFDETRKKFIDDAAEIGISHKSVRLRALDRMARQLEARGNFLGAAQLLEQAAKDFGGAFTNRRELSGPGGGAIPVDVGGARERFSRRIDALAERLQSGVAGEPAAGPTSEVPGGAAG